jgi:uncharacterized membrane protein YfcA
VNWTAFPVGVIIASLATMVGLGGGILWTPYLIFVIGLKPSEAVLTSLLIQTCGMGSGGVAAMRRVKISVGLVLSLAVSALPGVALGVLLQTVIDQRALVFVLGAACMTTALIFVLAREIFDFVPNDHLPLRSLVPYLWLPPLLSVLTGLLSIGVGDFLVPILRNRLRMRMGLAIGACLLLMACNAAVAAALHLLQGTRFPLGLFLWAMAGALAGGQIGPRLAHKISDQTLKEIFTYGLSLVGIHVLFNAW